MKKDNVSISLFVANRLAINTLLNSFERLIFLDKRKEEYAKVCIRIKLGELDDFSNESLE